MDGERWGQVALSLLAIGVMVLVTNVELLATVLGRGGDQSTDERGERGRRRSVGSALETHPSWAASLLVAQVFALALAASLLAAAFEEQLGNAGILFAVGLVGFSYVVFGQGIAQAVMRNHPGAGARFADQFGQGLGVVLRPFGLMVELAAKLMGAVIPRTLPPPTSSGTSSDERQTVTGDELTPLEVDETRMIDGILQLGDIRVRDIMVPRVDLVAVERTTPVREIVDTIIRRGHSRIPVYQESIDRVIGVLYAKDLLQFVVGPTEVLPLVSMLRPPYVVPESKRVDDLLTELRAAKVHLAIVADEYGGTAGLVTIEDILEEIVGEIQDEYDQELPLFEAVGRHELIADGRLAVEDVEDALEVRFEDDDYGTLGGFVQKHLGRLPEEGDTLRAEGVAVEIIEVERHRVRKMRISRVDPTIDEQNDASGTEPWTEPASIADDQP